MWQMDVSQLKRMDENQLNKYLTTADKNRWMLMWLRLFPIVASGRVMETLAVFCKGFLLDDPVAEIDTCFN